ncbi:cyclin-like protein [Actinidia rufa]|uniref:Cyclin-like protein n=1 Tax=Actinidia rufa TaxID=165716 RepID=A0A7J0EP63_9ERIC|nr:cyclin-like protein [Actinidia rufa]
MRTGVIIKGGSTQLKPGLALLSPSEAVKLEFYMPTWADSGFSFSLIGDLAVSPSPGITHHNEEDWAAKARAWAAAKSTTDYQPSQSQFTQVGRYEDQSHYNDQYAQTTDPHYPDSVQPSLPASGYQQYPPPAAPSYRPPIVHLQESASISSGQSSFVSDEHVAYTARDGILAGDSTAVFHHQESSPTSSSVHLQEVPSSYSSVTGIKEAGDQNGKFYKSFPLPMDSNQVSHQVHLLPSAVGRPVSMEQPHYAVGNQPAEASVDLSDQPLVFSHRFNHNHDQLTEPSYIHTDSGLVAAAPLNHNWTSPAMPGSVYPPIPPVLQSRQQHDPSIAVPSPVPGNSAPLFGRMPGPSFQPTIPSVGASFGIGAGSGLHQQTTAFPADVYGVSSVPERPKKAPVPNWLREEIIKNKAVIVNSASEHPKQETESIEDEAIDKSLGKADQADSKSFDSSKSTEEEDDDEDYVEAAKMAAINQEIKRILTEVLLKVTDELFDEIATKVLSEDDITVEVDQNVVASNHKLSPSAPSVLTPKASAKVLLPAKAEVTENEIDNGKSTSSSPGDVLGLASYASDDDEDDNSTSHQQPSTRKLSEDKHAVENGRSQVETEGHSKGLRNVEGHLTAMLNSDILLRQSLELTKKWITFMDEKRTENTDASRPNHSVAEKVMKTEMPRENISAKKLVTDDSQGKEARNKQDKNDVRVTKRSSSGKDLVKEVDNSKDRIDEKEDDKRRRQDERHVKKERTDDRNGSKERMKEQGGKSEEKVRESDSRKRSIHPDVKEDRRGNERDKRSNAEEDGDRRRDRTKDEKGERSRHKLASESSRHKRRHDSSDESSDDSKRKLHSKRRNSSPSPNRSRRRYSVS